jgi:bifunctional non-homologous end joining protein LigD
LTHPERVLFPGDGVTKGEFAEYYAEIGHAIVPHLQREPDQEVEGLCGSGSD